MPRLHFSSNLLSVSVVGLSVRSMEQKFLPPAMPTKPPYSWSVHETDQLLAGYEAGASLEQLSVWSGRSPHHVVVQLAWVMCGVSREDVNPLAPRFREPWSDEEDNQLGEFLDAGLSVHEIAHVLGRDVSDVAWRLVLTRQCRRGISRAG
jgi:hypothetical protein